MKTLAKILGVIAALVVGYRRGWVPRTFDALVMLPLGTSAVIVGLGFLVALDQPPLDLRTSILLIPIAHSLIALPFVVRAIQPALHELPRDVEEASATLSASPAYTFRRVILPALAPAILGGVKKQTQAAGLDGLGGLLGQLGGGGLLDQVLSPQPTDVSQGNDVLGQIFGSKDVSRTVAQNAAAQSGLDPSLLKQMLPLLAMLVTGYLAKQHGGAADASDEASAVGDPRDPEQAAGGHVRRQARHVDEAEEHDRE